MVVEDNEGKGLLHLTLLLGCIVVPYRCFKPIPCLIGIDLKRKSEMLVIVESIVLELLEDPTHLVDNMDLGSSHWIFVKSAIQYVDEGIRVGKKVV